MCVGGGVFTLRRAEREALEGSLVRCSFELIVVQFDNSTQAAWLLHKSNRNHVLHCFMQQSQQNDWPDDGMVPARQANA